MTDQERELVVAQMLRNMKQEKVERLRRLNMFVRKGQIVFAGSSLMEQFPIHEFLLDFELPYVIYNRGIGGLTTAEMLEILPETVLDLAPKYLFLNIGTNDLNVPEYRQEDMIARYSRILTVIREQLPGVRIFLLAYYPANPGAATAPRMKRTLSLRTNERVRAASEAVRELAAEHGAGFLDLNAGITDEQGDLKAEYTVEGMHMYATGYRKVLDALLPVLKSLEL